jgi:hypothetical protein
MSTGPLAINDRIAKQRNAGMTMRFFATCERKSAMATFNAADWLALAAAPTFAIMALLTGTLDGGPSEVLCSGSGGAFPWAGMVPMYLLMGIFHLTPWLKLLSGSQRESRGS